MSDKTPFVELTVAGTSFLGRTLALEMNAGLAGPRTGGWIDLDNRDGEVSQAVKKGEVIQVAGGRLGNGKTALLTGTLPKEPRQGQGSRKHAIRIDLADGWASTDNVLVVNALMDVTPREVMNHVLGLAGVTNTRLSAKTFPRLHHVVLDGVNLAHTARIVEEAWRLEDWRVGFDPDGLFFWESWTESPAATATPTVFGGEDLLRLERRPGETGVAEFFFEAGLFPGDLIELPLDDAAQTVRIEHRRHYFDGNRFRTEVRFGPIPS
ncbi:MAG: hypothetical protein FVQ81_13330 [Candidatus Glassbacteria bacterium]|nr:hypothetical protein [Candidatus Glassbacteria bacterium]